MGFVEERKKQNGFHELLSENLNKTSIYFVYAYIRRSGNECGVEMRSKYMELMRRKERANYHGFFVIG